VVISLADGGEFVNVKGALSLFGLTQSVAFQLGHQRSWMASALSLGAADHDRPHREVTNRTPHEAVQSGNTAIIRELLNHGADPGEPDKNKFTPVSYAINEDRPDVLKVLLESGANFPAKDTDGVTLWPGSMA